MLLFIRLVWIFGFLGFLGCVARLACAYLCGDVVVLFCVCRLTPWVVWVIAGLLSGVLLVFVNVGFLRFACCLYLVAWFGYVWWCLLYCCIGGLPARFVGGLLVLTL